MNRLGKESSLYLRQHQGNPVDWYPWGTEALELAASENRPILLSVGYSACHWCHVMAHESFEDPATAEVMNRLFVNVKVDREERPDLDRIYQTAHQLLTQRGGGWPLTVFLSPQDLTPFFAGTYFPKSPLQGMPAFTDVLVQLAQHYEQNADQISKQSDALRNALESLQPPPSDDNVVLDATPLAEIRVQLADNFDRDWGGFGSAPKFPHPGNLERLLRHWRGSAHASEPDVDALFMAALTLSRMQMGGVYDQVGGGFYRYAVDRAWQIPHFEKMLYDNGPLLALSAQLWQASGDDSYRQAATRTADWVLRDMRSAEGGFFATLDADSEGEEGRFYVWTPDEAASLLDADEYAVVSRLFGLDNGANFEGRWHLTTRSSVEDIAEATGFGQSKVQALTDSALAKLLQARNQRVWPGRDEKILTSWNALMIRGLAIAGEALGRGDLISAAATALDFLRTQLVRDGQLCASYAAGQPRLNAYLDDYACLLDATLELLQRRWDAEHLEFAIWLAAQLLERFEDRDHGGFFFTSHDHEDLLYRPKTLSDDAIPSGNGIAALALNRLGHLLGEPRYLLAAERTLKLGFSAMKDFPHGHATLITALDEYLHEPEVIVIRGSGDELAEWRDALGQVYAPARLVLAIPDDAENLPDALATRAAQNSTVAYVCRGTSCTAPLRSLAELAAEISEK